MSKPRGHSNAYTDKTKPHPIVADKAMIPIAGGASMDTVRDLPPLALSREEWQEIGERMGWFQEQVKTTKPNPAREWWASLTQEERDQHIKEYWPLSGPPATIP